MTHRLLSVDTDPNVEYLMFYMIEKQIVKTVDATVFAILSERYDTQFAAEIKARDLRRDGSFYRSALYRARPGDLVPERVE